MEPNRFLVTGGQKLQGEIRVSGSKNAALPILAAALLTEEPVILTNVPDIADIATMEHLLNFLGVKTDRQGDQLTLSAPAVANVEIEHKLVSKLRASILLLAPLLVRNGEVRLAYPGGCVLGKRPVDAHLAALQALGAQSLNGDELLHLQAQELKGVDFVMTEASVTATENAIMAAVLAKGTTTIRFAASEPHVQDLCHFLNTMGAKIQGIGTHTLVIQGVKKLHGTTYRITSDYLEAGTLVLAAALTRGEVDIVEVVPHHLDLFWQKLREAGVPFELGTRRVRVHPTKHLKPIRLQTAIFPSFPTDLQAPFATLLTQAKGASFVFETLFDGRLQYLYELEKMGAQFKVLNPYQAEIYGPTPLRGASVTSCDIRAGAAIVLAALAAQGLTEIHNIYYIDRGYTQLDRKLQSLGAHIRRIQDVSYENPSPLIKPSIRLRGKLKSRSQSIVHNCSLNVIPNVSEESHP